MFLSLFLSLSLSPFLFLCLSLFLSLPSSSSLSLCFFFSLSLLLPLSLSFHSHDPPPPLSPSCPSPALHLPGPKQPTVGVRFAPTLFALTPPASGEGPPTALLQLPYRSLFAVSSLDGVYVYDTQRAYPIAAAEHLHYTAITDLAWNAEASLLAVTSSDGYCTFLSFDAGELGQPLPLEGATPPHAHKHTHACTLSLAFALSLSLSRTIVPVQSTLCPCALASCRGAQRAPRCRHRHLPLLLLLLLPLSLPLLLLLPRTVAQQHEALASHTPVARSWDAGVT